MNFQTKERIGDSILNRYQRGVETAGINACQICGYAPLGERSARLVLTSSKPINLQDAVKAVADTTDRKIFCIAATFSSHGTPDDRGLYYATLIASRAAILMQPYDSSDMTKVCMNASATVFMDSEVQSIWERQTINGQDMLVRANSEDIESVLRESLTASRASMTASGQRFSSSNAGIKVNMDEFKIPLKAGNFVQFIGFEGKEGVPYLEVGKVMEVTAASVNVQVEMNGYAIGTAIPHHAVLNVVPVEAASSAEEVLDYLTRAFGPKWKEIVDKTGAFNVG